jgi:hypothetical protein
VREILDRRWQALYINPSDFWPKDRTTAEQLKKKAGKNGHT